MAFSGERLIESVKEGLLPCHWPSCIPPMGRNWWVTFSIIILNLLGIFLAFVQSSNWVLSHIPLDDGGAPGSLEAPLIRHNIRTEDKVPLNYQNWGLMPSDIWTLRDGFWCLTDPYLMLRKKLLFSLLIFSIMCWHTLVLDAFQDSFWNASLSIVIASRV